MFLHGITFTNLAALSMVALLLVPESIRRMQHALALVSTSGAPDQAFKRKTGHVLFGNVAALVLLGLAAYDAVFAIAYLANQ